MIEKLYEFKIVNDKLIERIVDDDNVAINHMILVKDTGLPEHFSNSNVYMLIIRGKMTISLNDSSPRIYEKGSILYIPYNTKMNVQNLDEEVLEFFVVKAPNPKNFKR
ncbi:cupin domain-containing protein [Thermovenabulum sp.]|uniref:cupin domain-containing protein n=1 Tax=Thermovenabulum sp. TaxID=3100335 RepID=UPI003C7D5E63